MTNKNACDMYQEKVFLLGDLSTITDEQVDSLFSELLSLLPNRGKLYKYKSLKNFHFDELSDKYVWFSSACCLNDNKDYSFNFNLLEDIEKIVKYFLTDNKFRALLVDGLYKELSRNNSGITKEDIKSCLECINKNGQKIGKLRFNKFCKDHKLTQEQKKLLILTIDKYGDDKQNEKTIRRSISDLANNTKKIRDGITVFSLTTSYKKDSMWAYYCGNKGICIEYDFSKINDVNLKKIFINTYRIKYGRKKKFSYVKILEANIVNDKEKLLDADKMIYEQLSTKDKSWATEDEWRVIQNDKSVNGEGLKVVADIISAVYVDYSVMKKRIVKQIIRQAKQNGWKIYVRYFNPIKAEYEYKTIEDTNKLIEKTVQIYQNNK